MASPLSQKFLEKIVSPENSDSWREPYVRRMNDGSDQVRLEGWFDIEKIEKAIEEIIEENDSERELRSAYPFEM